MIILIFLKDNNVKIAFEIILLKNCNIFNLNTNFFGYLISAKVPLICRSRSSISMEIGYLMFI